MFSTPRSRPDERAKTVLYGLLFLKTAWAITQQTRFWLWRLVAKVFAAGNYIFNKRCNKETLNSENAWF
ncbi:hypothetical protein [Polaromonas sp. CG_9.11]|uniref:hypothetical protein n=1 Tax=Polaromonas sp. CG_9.11 TaxID=2787730 RepID=UPI0018C9D925|nr:hypothetical protein [Polaromonas sp. CG_9.11]